MKAYTFAAHRLHLVARPVPVATAILAAAASQSGAEPMSLQAVVEASQNGQLGSAEDVKKMVFNAVRNTWGLFLLRSCAPYISVYTRNLS